MFILCGLNRLMVSSIPITSLFQRTSVTVWFDCFAVVSSKKDDAMMRDGFIFVGDELFKLFGCFEWL